MTGVGYVTGLGDRGVSGMTVSVLCPTSLAWHGRLGYGSYMAACVFNCI